MIAIDAYGICSSSAAASAAGPFSSRAAGAAGTAMITASASRYSGSAADPIVSRQPDAVRVSSRTIALTWMSAPEALATASGSAPSPVVRVTKSGAGFPCCYPRRRVGACAAAGGSSAAAASVSVGWVRAAAASGASVAWNDRSSERPA